MMMFSLRPTRLSPRPSMAASVSTRVVSWNDAADSHESVASDALVMPISSGAPRRDAARLDHRLVHLAEHLLVDPLARQEVGVTRLLHADAPGHLPDDQLDVLVVDRHALVAVHLLDLFDEVQLGLADALDLHELLGIAGTVDDGIAGLDLLAVHHVEAGGRGQDDGLLGALVGHHGDRDALALVLADADDAELRARRAAPRGVRASNSSTTRGRPPAMSRPATPPVWNVRIVSCVPGSPIDWAAMTPTASPSSIGLPVASERP